MGIFDGDQPAQLDEERRKLLSAGMELALKT
jgi:hypothetical protein